MSDHSKLRQQGW